MTSFVYPFNFVPPAAEQRLCRRNEYQPLNRYGGKTGRIEFTLTNLSPLFIPDSEQTTFCHVEDVTGKVLYDEAGKPQCHRVVDFLNIKGRLAIPGTALKGMFRAVAEAVSNSSFGVSTPPQRKFTFRKTTDLGRGVHDLRGRRWGRWQADETIAPLQAAKIWRDAFDQAAGCATDEKRSAEYARLRREHTTVQAELWQLHTGSPHVRMFSGAYTTETVTVFGGAMNPVQSGELRSRQERKQEHKSEVIVGTNRYKGPLLSELCRSLALRGNGPWAVEFRTVGNVPGQRGVREERTCWVKANGRVWTANLGTHAAILWPRKGWEDMTPAQRTQSYYVAALYSNGARPLPVADSAKQDYRDANDGELPRAGDIVRYYAESVARKTVVVEFGPVAMFKTPEQATVQEIAAKTPQILPCTKNTALCPASRLFGWTPESCRGEGNEDSPVAGRVRVGVAWAEKRLGDTRLIPLQILGSPKPQYYPFYLRPEGDDAGSLKSGYYALRAGGWWHRPGKLRGRKFYLHHPAAVTGGPTASCDYVRRTPAMVSKEVKEKHEAGGEVSREELCSHQNLSAAVLPASAEFKGYLEFDSLADYELGLVLWAVSLADSPLEGCPRRAHKLGLGRPIGLGSVRVDIDRIALWDPVGGWRAAEDPGEQDIDAAEAARLVKAFKTWLVTGEETPDDDTMVAEFDRQEFYRDLCEVLTLDLAGDGPVQYHPPEVPPYEGYRYFTKQRQKRHRGEEQPLQTPRDLRNGKRQT